MMLQNNHLFLARTGARITKSKIFPGFIGSFLQMREIKDLSRAAASGDRHAVWRLADAAAAPDCKISAAAGNQLSMLDNRDAIEAACEYLLYRENDSLFSICLKNNYFPEDKEIRAIFFLICGRIDDYNQLDVREDGPLLANGFHRVPGHARTKVMAAMREAGMGAGMASILSRPHSASRSGCSFREWRTLAESLAHSGEWKRMWDLSFDAPLPVAVETLTMLKNSGWEPDPHDAFLWKRLLGLLPDSWGFPDPLTKTPAILDGPGEAVNRLALHPSGGMLATGSYGGTITIFGLPSGSILHTFAAGFGECRTLLFSPDGTVLAASGTASGIHLISPVTGKDHRTIGIETGPANHVVFMPGSESLIHDGDNGAIYRTDAHENQKTVLFEGDGQDVTAMSSSSSGKTIFWGTRAGLTRSLSASGGNPVSYQGHDSSIVFIATVSDGQYLVTAPAAGEIRFWNVPDGTHAGQAGSRGMRSTAVAVSTVDNVCAFATDPGEVKVVSVPEGREIAAFTVWKGGVSSLEFSPDGSVLVGGGRLGHIHIWNVGEGRLIRSIKGHEKAVTSLSVIRAQTGALLASTGWDGSIALRSLPDGRLIQTMKGDPAGFSSLALARDGRLIVCGTGSGSIRARTYPDGDLITAFGSYSPGVTAIAPDSVGKHLACAGGDGSLNVWRLSDATLMKSLSGNQGALYSLAMQPGDRHVAGGGWDHVIRLWSFPGGELQSELCGHKSPVSCLAFTHDGTLLCSGSYDRTARIWDSGNQRCTVLEGHGHVVSCLAISPGDSELFTGSWDKTVRAWSLPEGRLLSCFSRHPARISALAVSPDSTTLAAGCEDGSISLRALPDGDLIRQRIGHMSPVRALAFTRDGDTLIAGYDDGTLLTWPLPWTKPLSRALPSDLEFVSRQVQNRNGNSLSSHRQWELLEELLKGKFRFAIGHSGCDSRTGAFDIEIVEEG